MTRKPAVATAQAIALTLPLAAHAADKKGTVVWQEK